MLVYGSLLWIDESNHSSINNKNKKIESYFKQIDVLNKTLFKTQDAKLNIFTNKVFEIESWFKLKGNLLPNFIEISASYQVPSETSFFGAHYKLEALAAARQLLPTSTDRFILLDADIIALRVLTVNQINAILNSDVIVYDISDQVFPVYGVERIKADLTLVAGSDINAEAWYGGEFICVSKRGLDRLLLETYKVLPTYFEHIKNLHHVGDEMFVSAALNIIKDTPNDLCFIEQKHLNLVSRHWSRFSKPSIDQHMESTFLHLPGSKPVLEFLSIFEQPLNAPIRALLKGYSLLVRLYQGIKKNKRQPVKS